MMFYGSDVFTRRQRQKLAFILFYFGKELMMFFSFTPPHVGAVLMLVRGG